MRKWHAAHGSIGVSTVQLGRSAGIAGHRAHGYDDGACDEQAADQLTAGGADLDECEFSFHGVFRSVFWDFSGTQAHGTRANGNALWSARRAGVRIAGLFVKMLCHCPPGWEAKFAELRKPTGLRQLEKFKQF